MENIQKTRITDLPELDESNLVGETTLLVSQPKSSGNGFESMKFKASSISSLMKSSWLKDELDTLDEINKAYVSEDDIEDMYENADVGSASKTLTSISYAYDEKTISCRYADISVEITAVNQLNDTLKFLINAQNNANQMFVTQLSTWYCDDNNIVHNYSTLKDALDANPNFSGKVNITENITWNYDLVGTESYRFLYLSSGNKIEFDLNGNIITMGNTTQLATIVNNTEVTFKNGTIYADVDLYSCTATRIFYLANGGHVDCKSLDIDIIDHMPNSDDYWINVFMTQPSDPVTGLAIDHNGKIWNYNQLTKTSLSRLSIDADILSSQGELSANGSRIEIDRFCNMIIRNSFHGYNEIFWLFSPAALVSAYAYYEGGITTASALNMPAEALKYGIPSLKPYIFCDGKMKIQVDKTHPNISNDIDLNYPQYGMYNNGAHRIGMDFYLGPDGELNIQHGHGIYSAAQNNNIILYGGKVVGDNAITMRSGYLYIPSDADPTVIGNGNYSKYNPTHKIGQAGSGIFLGHAVMLESNTENETSYGQVSACIQSGQFISKNNTSIASVGSCKNFNTFYKDMACFARLSGFTEGGMLNRTPSTSPYKICWTYDQPQITLSDVYESTLCSILSIYQEKSSTSVYANQIIQALQGHLDDPISNIIQTELSGYLIGIGYWHCLLSGCIDQTLSSVLSTFTSILSQDDWKILSGMVINLSSSYWSGHLNDVVGTTVGTMLSAGLLPMAYIYNGAFPFFDTYVENTDYSIVADGFATSTPTMIIKTN